MSATIDTTQFKSALRAYRETTKRSFAEILNQRAYNIAGRTVDSMLPRPGGEKAQRVRIKRYMDEPLSTRIKFMGKPGELASFYKRRGKAKNQLQRKHLIVQARRAKRGLKGLYGQEMRDASARFSQAAQVGVGFLKSAFLPIIKGLHGFVRFRAGIKTRWGNISVWPGSDGYGSVKPAVAGWNPFVAMTMGWRVPGTTGKVSRMVVPNLQAAFNAEAAEMRAHTERKLQAEANKINARR